MAPIRSDSGQILVEGYRKDPEGNPTKVVATARIAIPTNEQALRSSVSVCIEIDGWDTPLVDREIVGEDVIEALHLAMVLVSTTISSKTI